MYKLLYAVIYEIQVMQILDFVESYFGVYIYQKSLIRFKQSLKTFRIGWNIIDRFM